MNITNSRSSQCIETIEKHGPWTTPCTYYTSQPLSSASSFIEALEYQEHLLSLSTNHSGPRVFASILTNHRRPRVSQIATALFFSFRKNLKSLMNYFLIIAVGIAQFIIHAPGTQAMSFSTARNVAAARMVENCFKSPHLERAHCEELKRKFDHFPSDNGPVGESLSDVVDYLNILISQISHLGQQPVKMMAKVFNAPGETLPAIFANVINRSGAVQAFVVGEQIEVGPNAPPAQSMERECRDEEVASKQSPQEALQYLIDRIFKESMMIDSSALADVKSVQLVKRDRNSDIEMFGRILFVSLAATIFFLFTIVTESLVSMPVAFVCSLCCGQICFMSLFLGCAAMAPFPPESEFSRRNQ